MRVRTHNIHEKVYLVCVRVCIFFNEIISTITLRQTIHIYTATIEIIFELW
jgi:hypothetical protein